MPRSTHDRANDLIELARGNARFMEALHLVRALELPGGCIGAGAVRNLVWDALHAIQTPRAESDMDVAWFDMSDLSPGRDSMLQTR